MVLAACARVDISDSEHRIVHTVDIADIHAEIVSMCQDAYGTEVEVQTCIQDTLQQVLGALQNKELGQ